MKNSGIQWTTHTFNPWIGCTKVSPGCLHCYAEALNRRWNHGENWGKGAPRKRTSESYWNQPIAWNKAALDGNRRDRVFCASLADWLDDEIDPQWLADLLFLIRRTPHLDWLLLSKRPENFESRMEEVKDLDGDSLAWSWLNGNPPENVWIGTTGEDQKRANERAQEAICIPAKITFLSCEPLLEGVDLETFLDPIDLGYVGGSMIDWVIVGGESGPGARNGD